MSHPTPPGAGDPVPPPLDPFPPYQPGPSPFGVPQPYGYVGYPYDYGHGGAYGYLGLQPPRGTDGMAIASLVVSCVSVAGLCAWGVGGLLGVLGAIFGHVARHRIRASGAGGAGMALAGIIVGWIAAALGLLLIALFVVLIVTTDGSGFE